MIRYTQMMNLWMRIPSLAMLGRISEKLYLRPTGRT